MRLPGQDDWRVVYGAAVLLVLGFFLFRVLHSVVHCTFNFIPLRFVLYVISAGALWFMVIRAAMSALVSIPGTP